MPQDVMLASRGTPAPLETLVQLGALSLALGAAIVLLAAATACGKPTTWEQNQVDFDLVKIDSDKLVLRHDTVGGGEHVSKATFVLVDALNTHDRALDVTLSGELLDADGVVVGKLNKDSLRIPARGDKPGRRTFALVDDGETERATAVSARVRVTGALINNHAPAVYAKDGAVHPDGDRVSAAAIVHNRSDRYVSTLIIAAFYDADHRPIKRPFKLVRIDPGQSYSAYFIGPKGSKEGYIFVGQTAY